MKKFGLLILAVLLAAFVYTPAYAVGGAWSGTASLVQATDNQLTTAATLPNAAAIRGEPVRTLWVANASAITSSTMEVRCSPNGGTTYYPFYTFNNGTNVIVGTTAAATTSVMFQVPGDVSACTHIKVYFGTAQAANETVKLYGR